MDNNILLSGRIYHQSHGGAFVHNLFGGNVQVMGKDGRHTPFLKPHSTEFMGVNPLPDGDDRFFNNLFTGGGGLTGYDRVGPGAIATGGNLYLNGAKPWQHEATPSLLRDNPRLELKHTGDAVFLNLTLPALPAGHTSKPVDTTTLGKALLTDLGYTHPDGSPLKIDTDYFGKNRSADNPFPGPFEIPQSGTQTIKVWPLPFRRASLDSL